MALTSFLTGVTEPIEFTFMFLAPGLFAVHAVLTGLAMVIMHALDVHLGFGFSAGLFDYILNYSLSTNPLLLIPIGLGYFALYFVLFRWCIVKFNLKTLGREADEATLATDAGKAGNTPLSWIAALGGAMNLRTVEACTTRLRLTVADPGRIDERALKPLGSRGVLKLADGGVQVVVGPIADQLAAEIRGALRNAPAGSSADRGDPAALLVALGGRSNIARAEVFSSRIAIELRDGAAVDDSGMRAAGYRGATRVADKVWHVIVGPEAPAVAAQLRG
jgi:PTS system N-acetylglucosamine-specific IIC component